MAKILKALVDLIRRGLVPPFRTRLENGVWVVDLAKNALPVTTEHVRRMEADSE